MLTVLKSSAYEKWTTRLRDRRSLARIEARIRVIEAEEHFGDTEPVGDEVFELRFHFGPGYRVYYLRDGDTVVLLLNGGDKDSQERDIRRAKELAKEWRAKWPKKK